MTNDPFPKLDSQAEIDRQQRGKLIDALRFGAILTLLVAIGTVGGVTLWSEIGTRVSCEVEAAQ